MYAWRECRKGYLAHLSLESKSENNSIINILEELIQSILNHWLTPSKSFCVYIAKCKEEF